MATRAIIVTAGKRIGATQRRQVLPFSGWSRAQASPASPMAAGISL